MSPATNLCDGYQIWHALKVIGGEISITSCVDLRQSLVDLCTEFLLAIPVLRQFPKREGQLGDI